MSKIRMALTVDGSCYRGKDVGNVLKTFRTDYGVGAPDRTLPKWKQCEWVVRELKKISVRMRLKVWRVKQETDGREYLQMLRDFGVGRNLSRRLPPPVVPSRTPSRFAVPASSGRTISTISMQRPATPPASTWGVQPATTRIVTNPSGASTRYTINYHTGGRPSGTSSND